MMPMAWVARWWASRRVRAVLGGLAVVLVAACGGGEKAAGPKTLPRPVATVTVTPGTATLDIGTDQQLTAELRGASGEVLTGRTVTWTSENQAAATVSTTGLVTATGTGTTRVTATSEGKSGSADITVRSPAVAAITVSPATVTIEVGETASLSSTLRDSRGNALTGRQVAWTSADASIASVANDGVVTGVGVGQASVTASSEGKAGSATVTVVSAIPNVRNTTLATGGAHACQIEASGDTVCWGENGSRQLGDDSAWPSQFSAHRTPVVVQGGRAFVSITAGGEHTCGLVASGQAFCWGHNLYGQLGLGTTGNAVDVPTAVSGGAAFKRLSAGLYHTCGVTTTGQGLCWGNGALGNGSASGVSIPTAVSGNRVFAEIAAGDSRTCALDVNGSAWCWGTGPQGLELNPVAQAAGLRFVRITATSGYACGLTRNGQAWCWGRNFFGQLGNGTTTDATSPVAVSGSHVFKAIESSGASSCALDASGKAWCWGSNNLGQLGNGTANTPPFATAPVQVAGGRTLTELAVGSSAQYAFACGRAAAGVWCWGFGSSQLGHGEPAASASPVAVAGGRKLAQVSAGVFTTCGLTANGDAFCFGTNSTGMVGDGTTTDASRPAAVLGGLQFASIAVGRSHTCAITQAGSTWCWGANTTGQLGTGNTAWSSIPVQVGGGHTFTQVTVSRAQQDHTCALTAAGVAWCWGYNASGQLGDGSNTQRTTPVRVSTIESFVRLATGNQVTCGLTSDGRAFCWGYNVFGSLGDGTVTSRNTPVAVAGGHRFSAITTVDLHVCGIDLSGAAWCWGENSFGQLGDGSTVDRNVPTRVSGNQVFTSIVAGGGFISAVGRGFTCATTAGGELWCWGRNQSGELVDGTQVNRLAPTRASGTRSFSSLSAGGQRACGIGSDGEVYCWGTGTFGDGNVTLGLQRLPKRIFF